MEEKLKVSKSEAIYKALTLSIGASNDYYEKESFVYHHSICKHDIQDYMLTMEPGNISSNKAIWFFRENDSNSRLRYCSFFHLNDIEEENLEKLKNKANLIINYIMSN